MVTVRDGEKILAAAPLMSSKYRLYGLELRKIEFIATPASDYHSFLLTEKKPEYVKMMLEHVNRTATEWDCIELQEIPEDSETAKILRNISKAPFKFEERIMNQCPYTLLPSKFEDYLQGLSYSFRKNLRRYERKLQKQFKVDFRICNDIDNVDVAIRTFFDLHQKEWQSKKQRGAFSDQKFRDFHIDIARAFAKKGWLTLNFLMLNDEPVVAGYDFIYAHKLFYYLSGFNPRYSKYNVGHLRHMYLIKHCIEKGIKEYDFMRGNEPYKTRWNTTIRKNLEVRAIKRRIIPLVYDWLTKNDEFSPLTFWMGKHLSVK
jgi:CelD/BcsL family acetyltransferase involved in cellulose biosynthesis